MISNSTREVAPSLQDAAYFVEAALVIAANAGADAPVIDSLLDALRELQTDACPRSANPIS